MKSSPPPGKCLPFIRHLEPLKWPKGEFKVILSIIMPRRGNSSGQYGTCCKSTARCEKLLVTNLVLTTSKEGLKLRHSVDASSSFDRTTYFKRYVWNGKCANTTLFYVTADSVCWNMDVMPIFKALYLRHHVFACFFISVPWWQHYHC